MMDGSVGFVGLHSIEAEQQLLGAVLLNNALYDKARPYLDVEDFYLPYHKLLWQFCAERIEAGKIASPVSLHPLLKDNAEYQDNGGSKYLIQLAGHAIATFAIADYAEQIHDMALRRRLEEASEKMRLIAHETTKPAQESLSEAQALLEGVETIDEAQSSGSWMSAVTSGVRDIVEAQEGTAPRIRSGLPAVDNLLGGFGPGQFIVLGGRPSMGKSAIALSFVMQAAKADIPVIYLSLEMSEAELSQRAMSAHLAERHGHILPYAHMNRPGLSQGDMEAIVEAGRAISEWPICFINMAGFEMRRLVHELKRTHRKMGEVMAGKMPLVVIDYIQLLQGTRGQDRYQAITEISIALKAAARELQCPILGVAQLSRALEKRDDKRPMLSDLRESGQIEQDADTVLFCYRHEYYIERNKPDERDSQACEDWDAAMQEARGKLELIIAKQRRGPIGTAHLRFAPATNSIWEIGK